MKKIIRKKAKKKDEEEKISDTTNTFIKKSQIALNYDIKKIYAIIFCLSDG